LDLPPLRVLVAVHGRSFMRFGSLRFAFGSGYLLARHYTFGCFFDLLPFSAVCVYHTGLVLATLRLVLSAPISSFAVWFCGWVCAVRFPV
jgi:hypothetical protein